MDILLGVLWLAGITWAASKAIQHVRAEYRKSRAARPGKHSRPRHATMWWARETVHGFPVTRAGWRVGWIAHQTAMEQHRARREEAHTSHLEVRASIAEELRKHRERQAEAQQRIDQATVSPDDDELSRLRAARAALDARTAAEKAAGVTEETPEFQRLNTDVVNAEQAVPWRHRGATPNAATVAAQTTTEGTSPMATATEGSYTSVVTSAAQQSAAADIAAADVRAQRQRAEQILEEMQAADVDPASLSDQADHVARLQAAEAALDAVTESGEGVSMGLSRRHGGIKEAHDDAPVEAAESGWYKD